MRILLVATIYRVGEKIYPIIPELSKEFDVDVFMYNQMSEKTPWYGDKDPRPKFKRNCESLGINVIIGPGNSEVSKDPESLSLFKSIDFNNYDLVILDDNIMKGGWGTRKLCELAKRCGCIVVGCPHGNTDFFRYNFDEKIENWLDYSFVFGEKEKTIINTKYSDRLLPGGIPSNDIISQYPRNNKYILVITGYVNSDIFNKNRKNTDYLPFTNEVLKKSGIFELQKEFGLDILIKEKSRFEKNLKLSFSELQLQDGIRVIMDCDDDNKLIADSAMVIGSPSTLAFKSIQLGIPTVLLKGYGMEGNFIDFRGLSELNNSIIKKSLISQIKEGKDEKFIRNTLAGGIDFSSTNIYVDNIKRIIGNFL